MDEENNTDSSMDETQVVEPETTRTARGGCLAFVACCFIAAVTLSKILFPGFTWGAGSWGLRVQVIEQSIITVICSLLCMWLAWRPTAWLSLGKGGALLLLSASILMPWIGEFFTFFYSTSSIPFDGLFGGLLLWLGFEALLVGGYQFFGRFTRLQLVSRDEHSLPKRLTIMSFFVLTLFLAIPLAIDLWIRRLQSSGSTNFYIQTQPLYWLGGFVCLVTVHGLVAMMFALPRSRWLPLVSGLLFAVVLKAVVNWASFRNGWGEAYANNPNDAAIYREAMILNAATFIVDLILTPIGFWLIRSFGYHLRIADPIESGKPALAEQHPLA